MPVSVVWKVSGAGSGSGMQGPGLKINVSLSLFISPPVPRFVKHDFFVFICLGISGSIMVFVIMTPGIIIVPVSMSDPVLIDIIMSIFVFFRYGMSGAVPRAVIMGLPVAIYYSISG